MRKVIILTETHSKGKGVEGDPIHKVESWFFEHELQEPYEGIPFMGIDEFDGLIVLNGKEYGTEEYWKKEIERRKAKP